MSEAATAFYKLSGYACHTGAEVLCRQDVGIFGGYIRSFIEIGLGTNTNEV